MTDVFVRYPYLFPLFFVLMWFVATSMIAAMSGWFVLQSRYPDQPETPIRRWSMVSGRLGPLASYRGCLTLAVCPSGLRIGVWRIFGPFCRSFLVPWSDLRLERLGLWTRLVIGPASTGEAAVGTLNVSDWLASELAAAAGASWPEAGGAVTMPSPWSVGRKLLLQWLLISVGAALFFTLAPRLLSSAARSMPVAVAILFPALFFGVVTLIQFAIYLGRRQSSPRQ